MRITRNSGYTLVEILVASAIFSIISLVAFFIAASFYKNVIELKENIEAEKSLVSAMYNVQKYIGLATRIRQVPGPLNGAVLAANDGQIVNYNMVSMNGQPGQIDTVALFQRENGGYQTPPASLLVPTGIFYARPSPTTSGVIFIASNPAGALTPSYSGLFFERVVEFGLRNFFFVTNSAGVSNLTSVEVHITVRRFLNERIDRWLFCPAKDITDGVAGCAFSDKAPYKDISLTTRIAITNQITAASDGRSSDPALAPYERTFGNIYLFPQR